jgi:hypothetical protein
MAWRIEIHADDLEIRELADIFDHIAPFMAEGGGQAWFLIDARDGEDGEEAGRKWVARLRGLLRLMIDNLDVEITLRLSCVKPIRGKLGELPLFAMRMCANAMYLRLAQDNQSIAQVLQLMGGELGWHDISATLEIIERDAGGAQRIVDAGWLAAREWENLKDTASGQTSSKSMTPGSAIALTRRIVLQWLGSMAAAAA